jgi:hypothetical protein
MTKWTSPIPQWNSNEPLYQQIFVVMTWTVWLLYAVVYLGVSLQAPEYLKVMRDYAQLYIGLILLYRFNPFWTQPLSQSDANIASSAGVILVLSSTVAANMVSWLLNGR